jgi:amicoumacin kinase
MVESFQWFFAKNYNKLNSKKKTPCASAHGVFSERNLKMLLRQLSERYGVLETEFAPLNDGFHNVVYQYRQSGRDYILRITNSKRRNRNEIESEIEFVLALAKQGVPVSVPVPSSQAKMIEVVSDQDQIFFAVTFEKANGKPVDVIDKTVWNADLFYHWGKVVGKMHLAAHHLTFVRPVWTIENPDILNLEQKITSNLILERYLGLLTQLKNFDKDPELFGLIHNDFHQGNFFVNNGIITVFDFDECAYHWFAYDVAVAFYHAYWQSSAYTPEDTDFSSVFWTYFLKGYQQAHPLKKEMIQQIPLFLKMREIFLYVLFLEKWDMDKLEDWQEYTLANLKNNIEKNIPYSNFDFSTLL